MAEVRHYFPSWRIFIFGVDVTADVTRCLVNVTGSEARAPSTAEVELVNGGASGDSTGRYLTDRYVTTARDIATIYGTEDELPQIQFPELKDVLRDVLEEESSIIIDFGLPTLSEALAILDPSEVTGAPSTDETRARALLDQRGQSETQYRREAQRRSTAANVARERTANITRELLETTIPARRQRIEDLVRERIRATIDDPIKRRVMLAKFPVRQRLENRQPNLVDPVDSTTVAGLAQLTGDILRYPFQSGDSIFHTNDPVRIFWRDPAAPERWYHMFSGFVSDSTDVVDENDQRLVRLRLEDASRVIRYARLSTNPGVLDQEAAAVANDSITRTFFNDGFADLTLPQFLFTVIFGAEQAGTAGETGTEDVAGVQSFGNTRYSVNGQSESTLLQDAIGSYNFERSFVGVFGPLDEASSAAASEGDANALFESKVPSTQIERLAEYQALVDHRVYLADLDNMALPDGSSQARVQQIKDTQIRKRSNGDYLVEDVVDAIGENPHLFPVDYGRLCLLMPASLGPGTNKDLLLKDLIGVNTQTTWRTRLSLIYDVMGRLDFQFYASPKGDLLCEMPLYDFEPDDFGRKSEDAVNLQELLGRSTSNMRFEAGADKYRGPYGPQYTVAKSETQSWERTFSDEHVRTQMLGVYNLVPGFASLGDSKSIGSFAPVVLWGLVPQFGVRAEPIDPMGIISNENAARIYANVQLNKTNANARTATVKILPRVQLGHVNRPLEFEERTFVGTLTSVSHSLVWGVQGTMSTDMNLKYIRAWGGQTVPDGDKLRPVYEPIGGFASQALNYAIRFGLRDQSIRSTKDRGG